MAIENSKDTQILNLLENDAPLKAIKVDFLEGNNKNLIIRFGFPEAYSKLSELKEEGWYYIIKLNQIMNCIDVIGLVQMKVEDGVLNISWLETNKAFKKKGYSREIIKYLVRYAEYLHLKEINSSADNKIWKLNGFEKKLNLWTKKISVSR